ncbi:MAG: hypothetical protein U0931_34865 [Vulcanimicrobiota bacterium]
MELHISGTQKVSPQQLGRLRGTAERAVAFFEENFGPVEGTLGIELDPQTLSTGYDRERDVVNFPQTGQLINAGLDSADVVDHELFHALLTRRYPHTGSPAALSNPEGARLHEGLADFFAFKLQPDEHFGENYRTDTAYLRAYRNDLTVSLSPGSHAQGNAITAHLLRAGVEMPQIRAFLDKGEFTLQALQQVSPQLEAALQREAGFGVEQRAVNYPDSAIKRYRISPERPLEVDFRPNQELLQAHPGFRVAWTNMDGLPSQEFKISSQDERSFQVVAHPTSRPEKLLAVFYDEHRQIGFQPYYLSAAS